MKMTKSLLNKLELPIGKDYPLPFPGKKFMYDAQYRFEVLGIQGSSTMKTHLEEVDAIDRVTQNKGIIFFSDNDIIEMVNLSSQAVVDLVLTVEPIDTYDTSASV